MPVIKIQVRNNLGQLRRDVHQLVDELFQISIPLVNLNDGWVPAVNICETADELFVIADMAGVDAKSLSVTLEGRLLRLAGTRRSSLPPGRKRFYLMEMGYGPFERLIRLPVPVEAEEVEARYEDGILTVCMGKKKGSGSIKISLG